MHKYLLYSTACLVALATFAPLGAQDCNRNGVADSEEIAAAVSEDCNADGVPDECEFVPFEFGFRQETFPVGDGPRLSVSVDLNRDGLADVVIGHQTADQTSTVSVLLARPGGSFEPSMDYAAGTRLSALSVADLDADGALDVVTAHSTELLLFKGTGEGSLEAPRSLAVVEFNRFVTAVDLTADGLPELVIANTTDDTVAVLPNQGDLRFGSPATYFADERPVAVSGLDLDGDGDGDLVVANADSRTLLTMINSGRGTLSRGVSRTLDAKPTGLKQGDLNADGNVDLMVTSTSGFSLLLSPGDGTLPTLLRTTIAARDVELGDFDGDADLDLAVAHGNARGLTYFANRGDGDLVRVRDATNSVWLVDAGDFDGDGDVDIALTNEGPSRVNVLWNAEPGAVPLDIDTYPTGGHSHALALADFDRDGDLDVATVEGGDRAVSLLFNDGGGVFARPVIYAEVDSQHLHHVIAEDLDRDGDADIVAVGRGTGLLWVLINQGDGTFADFVSYLVGAGPWMVAASDLDGDGDPDLACANSSSNDVTLLFNNGAAAFENSADLEVGAGPLSLGLDDLDGDGVVDLVVAETNASAVSVRRGRGDGTFGPGVASAVSTPPGFVLLADLDDDGDVDVVTANRGTSFDPRVDGPGDLGIFLNDAGQLRPERSFPVGHLAWSVISVDLDRDGRLDLVSSSQQGNNASLLIGAGDGTFASPIVYNVGESPRFILAGDLDNDAQTDLVTSDRISKTITVLLNRAGAAFYDGDFLRTVCTALDFHKVSVSAPADNIVDRVTRFLLPARDDDASLAPALFPNLSRFPRLDEFLRTVFPERFGARSQAEIEALWSARATRDYFAGEVRRLLLDDGETIYGLDVTTDGSAEELLSEDEVRSVRDRLRLVFGLEPLAYAPRSLEARERAAAWDDADFRVILLGNTEPEPPPVIGTPTFELEIPEDTELCGVFAEAGRGRGVREEYELKTRVRLRAGIFPLPTGEATFAAELFEEVLFGPERESAEALASGEFRRTIVPGELTTFRFTYSQPFVLADGRRLELAITAPLMYQARGDEPVTTRRRLGPEFFVAVTGTEPVLGTLDGVPLVRFGSCSYSMLDRWLVVAELADGTELLLEERYEEAASRFETAPAMVTRAEVRFAAGERVVRDYFDLVYSAQRHNTAVDYWVVLEPPLALDGDAVAVIELQSHEPGERAAVATYLSPDLEPLRSVAAVSFFRGNLPEAPFRRGDATADGTINLLDVFVVLDHLFSRDVRLTCLKAGDWNDSGAVNLLDAVSAVTFVFRAGVPAAEPFQDCGTDPTADALSCEEYPSCR